MSRPLALTVTVLLLEVMLPVPVVSAPVSCRLTRPPVATTLLLLRSLLLLSQMSPAVDCALMLPVAVRIGVPPAPMEAGLPLVPSFTVPAVSTAPAPPLTVMVPAVPVFNSMVPAPPAAPTPTAPPMAMLSPLAAPLRLASTRKVPAACSDSTVVALPSVIDPVCRNRSPAAALVADSVPPTVPICSGLAPITPMPPLAVSVRLPVVAISLPEPLSVMVPARPLPPSAFKVRFPVPSVTTWFTAMPPVLLMMVRPPLVIGVMTALMVVAPVCAAEPTVSTPVVTMVFSSGLDSSSVDAAVSNPLPRLTALPAVVVLTVTPPAPVVMEPPDSAILSEVKVSAPVVLPMVPTVWVSSVLAPVTVKATVPAPPAVTLLAMVMAPLELRAMLPLAAVAVAPLVPSVPVFTTLTLPVFWLMPAMVRFALLVRLTLPAPALVALKLVTALPLPVRVVPPLDLVVKRPAITPLVPPASLIEPAAPVPPSAVRFRALAPAPEVNTLLMAMPPVWLSSVVPAPVALVVATAALTVMAPVSLALPMVSPPVVVTVRSSAAESSSVPPVVSSPLPRLIASLSVLLLRVTAPLPPVTVPPVSAILSAVRFTALPVPLLLMMPVLVSMLVPPSTVTAPPPAMMVPALVTPPAPVTLVPLPPTRPMTSPTVLVSRPLALTVTVLLLEVMLPVPVVSAPVSCRLTRPAVATALLLARSPLLDR